MVSTDGLDVSMVRSVGDTKDKETLHQNRCYSAWFYELASDYFALLRFFSYDIMGQSQEAPRLKPFRRANDVATLASICDGTVLDFQAPENHSTHYLLWMIIIYYKLRTMVFPAIFPSKQLDLQFGGRLGRCFAARTSFNDCMSLDFFKGYKDYQ